MRIPLASVVSVVAAAVFLPWIAVTLYGLALLWNIEHRVVLTPGSFADISLQAAFFLLAAFAWGVGLGAITPSARLLTVAVLSGLLAGGIYFAQIALYGLGLPGSVEASLSLIVGIIAGALVSKGLNREA